MNQILNRVLDRTETESLSRVDRLAAACHAVRMIVESGADLTRRQESARGHAVRQIEVFGNKLPRLTASPVRYKTGGMFGQTAKESAENYNAESFTVPDDLTEQILSAQLSAVTELQGISGEADTLQIQADRLSAAIQSLTAEKPRHAGEADFLSALSVCHADYRWDGKQNENQNQFGFNGSIIPPRYQHGRYRRTFNRGQTRRGKLSSCHGRGISAARGYRVWKHILESAADRPSRDTLSDRDGADSIRAHRVRQIVRELDSGKILSCHSLTHSVLWFDSLSDSTAFSAAIRDGMNQYGGQFYIDRALSGLFAFRRHYQRLSESGMIPARCRAVNRAARNAITGEAGTACQIRLTVPEYRAGLSLSVSVENYSRQTGQRDRQTAEIIVPLVSCLSLTTCGLESEYAIGRIRQRDLELQGLSPRVSAAVIRCLEGVQSIHSSGLESLDMSKVPAAFDGPEISTDTGKAVWKVTETADRQLRYHLSSYLNRQRGELSPVSPDRRSAIARIARRLNSLNYVSLSDSYAVGNCKAGTADFCRRWGISENRISGAELCRLWKRHGWKAESLFVAVLERVTGVEL
jgi:hypothetical protein